ncbi:hypothetical protein D9758_012444 [Tetrapyrgos nigripes]|uniref:RNase H type-1 domain-containing protein n=1 Tax=Tetrapyrgos nigripes TaxID=182062 RepID=A0A8H5CYQ6_9AGAR|nr:hypothetical protein D9758_012444 [Tetrapyrgos nigripes]
MDETLSFNFHVKHLITNAGKALGAVFMLGNTRRGLSPYHMRLLYVTCVTPVMTYASAVWWTGKVQHEKLLTHIQNRALRLICASFRTTPIDAMEVEASIPPIRITLDGLSHACALRYNKLSVTNPVIQRLPDWHSTDSTPLVPPPLPFCRNDNKSERKRTTHLRETAKLTSPNDERISPFTTPPWRRTASDFNPRLCIKPAPPKPKNEDGDADPKEEKKRIEKLKDNHLNQLSELFLDPSHIILYTDGSKRPVHGISRSGAGLVAYNSGVERFTHQIGLGSRAEIYDAEIIALSYAAGLTKAFTDENPQIQHWHFFTDNSGAVQTIFDTSPKPGQTYCTIFWRRVTDFLDALPNHTVEISWVPSHTGIVGNERADGLAKDTCNLANNEGWIGTRSHAIRRNRERKERQWKRKWENRPITSQYLPANRIPPSLKPTKLMKETKYGLNREVFGRVTQCRTGHGFIGEYYKRFVPDENVDCPCGEALQTREHVLCDCPIYEPHRDILRGASENLEMPELLGTKDGIEALTEFIQKSGAFTKTGKPLHPPQPPNYQPLDETALMLNDEYWEDLTGGSERDVVTQGEVVDDELGDFG